MIKLDSNILNKLPEYYYIVDVDISTDNRYRGTAINIFRSSSFSIYGHIKVLSNNEQVNLLNDSIDDVELIASLSNGNIVSIPCDVNSDACVIVEMSNQDVTQLDGEVLCEILVRGHSEGNLYRYSTFQFRLNILA